MRGGGLSLNPNLHKYSNGDVVGRVIHNTYRIIALMKNFPPTLETHGIHNEISYTFHLYLFSFQIRIGTHFFRGSRIVPIETIHSAAAVNYVRNCRTFLGAEESRQNIASADSSSSSSSSAGGDMRRRRKSLIEEDSSREWGKKTG